MAGRGPTPGEDRQNRHDVPSRGDWAPAAGVGWQHGDPPRPPSKLTKASRDAWDTWMGSWFAAFWSPADLPGLRQVIRLYDQVERGEFQRSSELRLQMDTYGITPKGQQDRRWKPPVAEKDDGKGDAASKARYGHLRPVDTNAG